MSSEVGSIVAPVYGTIPGLIGGVLALTNTTLLNSNIYSNQIHPASDKLSKTRAFEPLSGNLKKATSTTRTGLPTNLSLSTREGSSPSLFSKHSFSSGLLSGDDQPQILRPSTQPHASERQARLSDLHKPNESDFMSHRFPDKATSHISHETTSKLNWSQDAPSNSRDTGGLLHPTFKSSVPSRLVKDQIIDTRLVSITSASSLNPKSKVSLSALLSARSNVPSLLSSKKYTTANVPISENTDKNLHSSSSSLSWLSTLEDARALQTRNGERPKGLLAILPELREKGSWKRNIDTRPSKYVHNEWC